MLVEPSGKDALLIIAKPSSPLSQGILKTPPKIRKIASLATIPAATILGYVMTPSRRLVAHAVGAGLTGIIGTVTKSRLDAESEEAAKPALAKLLLEHVDNQFADWTDIQDDVKQIASDYQLDKSTPDSSNDDFDVICSDIYSRYLVSMAKNPMVKTSEISELQNLRQALLLSNVYIGEAHVAAARELYRQITQITPEEELEDEDSFDRKSIDKLLFLSERAFSSSCETKEAFNYEMLRFLKIFKISSLEQILDRVYEVAEPFYKRALASTRSKLDTGAVNSDMLLRARTSLGINDEQAKDLHLNAYAEDIQEQLGEEEDATFPQGTKERIRQLQDILGVDAKDAVYELSHAVTPLFQTTVNSLLDEIIASSSEDSDFTALHAQIQKRQDELLLTEESTVTPLLQSIIIQKLGHPLEAASNFARVNNQVSTIKELNNALYIKKVVQAVFGNDERLDLPSFFNPEEDSSCNGFLLPEDRKRMYTIYLQRLVPSPNSKEADEVVSFNAEKQLKPIQDLLGLTEYDCYEASRVVCGPLIEKELKGMAFEITGDDDWTEELEKNLSVKLAELKNRLQVTQELIGDYAINVYKDSIRVTNLKFPSGIPSADMAQKLSSLCSLFSLDEKDIQSIHYTNFGAAYKKSVLESLGSTGIIRPEYRDALDTLRKRLQINKEDGEKLFLEACGEQLKPMIQLLANELERTMLTQQQLSQKRGKDMGEDVFRNSGDSKGSLGIASQGNLMSDAMNVVNFYKENNIGKVQKGTEVVEKEVISSDDKDSEEKGKTTVTEEVPVFEQTYPITARSLVAVDGEMAIALFRQFVVGSVTASAQAGDADAGRYEEEITTLGNIIGLTLEQQQEVSGGIAELIYDNYLTNAFKTKSSLDQQDMMFIATMQNKLVLTDEQSQDLLLASQKKCLREEASSLFSTEALQQQKNEQIISNIKNFRDKCNTMGLDMSKDIELPIDRVQNLFSIEVINGINTGAITPTNTDAFSEIQESLGLSDDDAEAVLFKIIERQIRTALENIDRHLMRGRQEECVPEITKILSYTTFAQGEEDGKLEMLKEVVTDDVKKQILMVFENSIGSELQETDGKEVVDQQRDMLSAIIGINA